MVTYTQLSRKKVKRLYKNHYCRTKHLRGKPQRRGVCVRVYITTPKKPNSAQRKIAKVALGKSIRARKVLVAIPGQGHNLAKFSVVMVRGGRARDIPGVRYKMIRMKYDFIGPERFTRTVRRSFYGYRKPIYGLIK